MNFPVEGTCHCGGVAWRMTRCDSHATVCNCSICRRYGVLWAYDYEGEGIVVSGETATYVWGDREIGFHFCPSCGCVAYWRGIEPNSDGRRRIAVNVRLAPPQEVADMPIRHFDGAETWTDGPDQGRHVGDYTA